MKEPIRVKSLDPTLRDEIAELLHGYDFSNCLTCGMCTAGCVYSDLHEDQDPRKFLRKVVLGMREEAENDPFIWNCTMCNRCTVEYPMGVNINAITRAYPNIPWAKVKTVRLRLSIWQLEHVLTICLTRLVPL